MSQSRRATSRGSSSSSLDKNVSNSNSANTKRSLATKKESKQQPTQKSPAGYKVLGQEREMSEDELWNANGSLSDRATPTSSRSSFGSRPVSNTSRRTPTPSKQISLQAVKRKEEVDEPLEPIDWNDFNRAVSQNECRFKSKNKATVPESGKKDEASAKTGDTSSDEDSEEEDLIGERGKAPNALLMEFVSCLMEKDYENAEKLCKMILIYEPDNPEALSFLPVIQEKREIDAEEPEGSGSDDSDDESDDSGEDSDDDDDDDDSSGSDDDDDDDDDDEDGGGDEPGHPDSGIASANSD